LTDLRDPRKTSFRSTRPNGIDAKLMLKASNRMEEYHWVFSQEDG